MKLENGTIRDIDVSFLPSILEIERNSYSCPWPAEVFVEELSLKWSKMWGYFPPDSDNPVGFIFYWKIYDELHILNLAVHPAYRRKGIGKELLGALITHGLKDGFKIITLEVRQSNAAAINLYKSFNFRIIGIRKGYYCDNNEDAYIMALNL